MSNHSGSYMLNEVLHIMEEYQILQNLNSENRCDFFKKITKMAVHEYDCNAGEILDEIGKRYGICYSCFKEIELKENGVCKVCFPE